MVKADSRREAIIELDEWAGAEPAWLVPMDECMIDFRLNDQAEIDWWNSVKKQRTLYGSTAIMPFVPYCPRMTLWD